MNWQEGVSRGLVDAIRAEIEATPHGERNGVRWSYEPKPHHKPWHVMSPTYGEVWMNETDAVVEEILAYEPEQHKPEQLRAIVVTGGTQVDIDSVRVITNRSKGRLGVSIGNALSRRGVQTTVLAAESVVDHKGWFSPGIRIVKFRTYGDLVRELEQLIGNDPPDFIFMPAAISDFAPVPVEGKIRSDQEEMQITIRRLTKILAGLRERCGIKTFIVGFKLLSGVSERDLVETAMQQNQTCRINITIANDARVLAANSGRHIGFFVTPEGGAIPFNETKAGFAQKLVDFCLHRQNVRWSHAVQVAPVRPEADMFDIGTLLHFGQMSGLLSDSAGNVTCRIPGTNDFLATPRGVEKGSVLPRDILLVSADSEGLDVRYSGPHKPSIDSAVHGYLYRAMPDVAGLLHFHKGYTIPDFSTGFPFPCGTIEEAEEIERNRGQHGVPFVAHLVHHGYLLGVEQGGGSRLQQEWSAARSAWAQHWGDIGEPNRINNAQCFPILSSGSVVGVVARSVEDWYSIFLLPLARGQNVGRTVAQMLHQEDRVVATHDDCNAIEFYKKHGFIEFDRLGNIGLLRPV